MVSALGTHKEETRISLSHCHPALCSWDKDVLGASAQNHSVVQEKGGQKCQAAQEHPALSRVEAQLGTGHLQEGYPGHQGSEAETTLCKPDSPQIWSKPVDEATPP